MSIRMNSLRMYAAVGIGGMVGAGSRYSISLLFQSNVNFPFATLTANLLGCFLLSFLLHHAFIKQRLSSEMLAAIGTGAIGAFTTFSTFAVETIELWQLNWGLALTYIVISIFGGLGFCYLGYRLANRKEVQV